MSTVYPEVEPNMTGYQVWKRCYGLEETHWISDCGDLMRDADGFMYTCEPNYHGYIQPQVNRKRLYVHRLVLTTFNPAENMEMLEVDHKDGDRSNNRVSNLRWCVHRENGRNQLVQKVSKSSRTKGVYWNKENKKWRARIRVDGNLIHLGYFDSEVDAAYAYDVAATHYFGRFARLNVHLVPDLFFVRPEYVAYTPVTSSS